MKTRRASLPSDEAADRSADASVGAERLHVSPSWESAAALDLLCVRFALRTVLSLGARFNMRRDVNNVVTLAGRFLVWPEPTLLRLRDFLARRCADSPPWAEAGRLSLDEFMQRHGSWNGLFDDASLYYYLDEFVKLYAKDLLGVLRTTVTALDARLAKTRIRLIDNIEMLAAVLGLTDTERSVLMHASLCKYQRDLRPVLVDCKAPSAQEAYGMLAQVLGLNAADVASALKSGGRLESLGLIETPIAEHSITDLGDLMRVSDKLLAVLTAEYPSESSMMAAFTRPAGRTGLTLADFPHVGDDARYLVALLQAAACAVAGAEPERGINVLVYGPPGTGKTELAKLLAQQADLELYEVDCLDKDGNSLSGKERYRSLQVSQAFLRGRPRAALLFDEVEDVFPPIAAEIAGLFGQEGGGRGAAVNGKAWVNQTLEQNPVPTIWISNSIGQIDPAYRRRFQFHLELANPPQRVRENIARKYLLELGVSDAFVARIAARRDITPAQVQSAARFARLARRTIDEPVESLIDRQLERADKALGHVARDEFRVNVTQYDLSLLNVESRHPVPKMIEALKARPVATLCFYGLPGTGKTALAEHIARCVERPLMIRRASDLMSKYVGETEQQMARMFADAQREQAVLLLDEADSFLQNRKQAVRNYEVSEVNEMLQGMERFDGIFICTTNLLDRIDEAALRRFAFKLKFLPLDRGQRERMFIAEVLDGDSDGLDDALRARLARLELLCPGDFAAVKRQFTLFGEKPQAADFLERLEAEHALKPDVRWARPMGFVR
ncbi:MAG: AAA family ATPase [Burkholderiaceae bacterium]